ncbi:MAG TPA: PEPxxWA-CTERM sorting domain-containing protein [Caulobacteraceae bacterium]|jgi:hypothetical protein|nr:PEPxxWA-CTERM sorting domain-containing protein [Caulobacteraceae bacterium]
MRARDRIFAALPLICALALTSQARAYSFTLGGDGMTASGSFSVGPDSHIGASFGTGDTAQGPGFVGLADPLSAQMITGGSGTFSDSNIGIVNATITGVVANNYLPHFAPDPNLPFSFSWYNGAGFPASPASTLLSYDNLFYGDGAAPITCIGVPAGGFLDNYGVLFTLSNGDVLDIWSDGGVGSTIYGAAVSDGVSILDYQDPYPGNSDWLGSAASQNVSFTAAPEPSTWAMMILGFAGLGYVLRRSSRKALAA